MENEDAYAIHCSQQTLQNNSQGFFRELVQKVSGTINPLILSECSTDFDRIRYCAQSTMCWELIGAEMVFKGKDEEDSVKRRLEGNEAFEKGDLKRALLLYCQSIIRAPVGEQLALVYSNRSTLLQKMGDFQLAINDAELAIAYGYPDDKRHKLYERMTSCYLAVHNIPKAKVTLRLGKHLAEKSAPEDINFFKKLNKLQVAIDVEELKLKTDSVHINSDTNSGKVDGNSTKTVTGTNKKFSEASPKFDVTYNEEQGRYAVSTDSISTGEEILRERPFASCLLPERMGSHCLHCFARLKAPIACENCANVAYCGRACQREGDKYHRYECKVLALLIGAGMSILSHLALRIVTQSSAKEFVEKFSKLQSRSSDLTLNELGEYDSSAYENVYNLVALEKQRSTVDYMERCVMSVFLMKCLRLVGYFENLNIFKNPTPTKDELIVGSVILRNLQILQFNAYEITEFIMESNKHFRNSKMINLGLGVYNVASYLNHSCAPNVGRYFDGKTLVIKSIDRIQSGQAIVDNYGPRFIKMPRNERQFKLRGRYWFTCNCEGCNGNWPLLPQFSMTLEGNNKNEKSILAKLEKLDKMYLDKGMELMDKGNGLVATEYLKKYLDECIPYIQAMKASRQAAVAATGDSGQNENDKNVFHYKSFYLGQEALKLCLSSQGTVHFLNSK